MPKTSLPMTRLKLIDELLCDLKQPGMTWEQVEKYSSVTREAMQMLRREWHAGRMKVITLSLANYFRDTLDV